MYTKVAAIALICSLYGCGDYGNVPQETTDELLSGEENSTDIAIESTMEQETGKETTEEATEKITEEVTELPEMTEETDRQVLIEEKWDEYWADGEFTFEETELILQAAGYHKREDGFYWDENGSVVDVGLTYDFILDGYVFKQQENGSYRLVSFLEAKFGDYDSDYIDSLICDYGYEVEYNNDIPIVYDGNGDGYSYIEFASLLLNGESIPYAPQPFSREEYESEGNGSNEGSFGSDLNDLFGKLNAIANNYMDSALSDEEYNRIIDDNGEYKTYIDEEGIERYVYNNSPVYEEKPKEEAGRETGILSNDNAYIYVGDIVYSDSVWVSVIPLRGIVVKINIYGGADVIWTDAYESSSGQWTPLYTDGIHCYYKTFYGSEVELNVEFDENGTGYMGYLLRKYE